MPTLDWSEMSPETRAELDRAFKRWVDGWHDDWAIVQRDAAFRERLGLVPRKDDDTDPSRLP